MLNYQRINYNTTVLPNPGIMFFLGDIIPVYGPTIQVSEVFWYTHLNNKTFSIVSTQNSMIVEAQER